jgi:RNA polymerase-binding protein DksA
MDRTRYSESELEEFRGVINKKLERHRRQLVQVQEQLREMSEAGDDDYSSDWLDNSSVNTELEMLTTMAERQIKYIHALEDALVRIEHKTYGVCVITGKLIDKKRLLAVPTTTKSIEGKNLEGVTPPKTRQSEEDRDQDEDEPKPKKAPSPKKVTTRVIRKSSGASPAKSPNQDDESDSWLDQLTGHEPYQPEDTDLDEEEDLESPIPDNDPDQE